MSRLLQAALLITIPAVAGNAEADWSGYATLASEYNYRGLAMTDGNPAVQLGIDYEHDSGLFAGAWGSTVDLRTGLGDRDWEFDLYAGYHFSNDSPWTLTILALRYTYPAASGDHPYDYTELIATVGLGRWVSVQAAWTDDLFNLGSESRHAELNVAYPATDSFELSGTVGWTDYGSLGPASFAHFDIGVSYLLPPFSFDVRYYGNESPDEFIIGAPAAGSEIVGSVTVTLW